ncbi:AEC family transporter [Nioella nitratireducens]|uniref:AEC family transporter n=1 Tax=Nioella nitratireducens TaxID=1287720 RepID=UPI0008FD354E|nr:AEC family transporter [Nioella nitratireducens]
MPPILSITLPIYLLIALGFFAVRSGYFAGPDVRAIGSFVVKFALPALIFVAVGSASPSEVLQGPFFLAYLGGSVALFVACLVVGRLVFKMRFGALGLTAMGLTVSNSAFVGFPLMSILLPDRAVTVLATAMLVELTVLIPVALAISDAGESSAETPMQGFLQGLANLPRNPIILSLVAALAYSASGITLPEPILRPIEMLRPIASPVALFAVGGTVAMATNVREMVAPATGILIGKLVLHPLFMLAALALVPGVPPELRLAATINAACPMLSIYPIFGMRYGRELLTSAVLLVTTATSFVTITLLLSWLGL